MDTALLVRLSISQWNARKLDRTATQAAKERAGAGDKAGVKVYKSLIAAEALDAIETIANAARIEHRKRTVPWQYDGPGAISAVGYPDYKAQMAQFEARFYRAVDRFCNVYDRERVEAQSYLGTMFNPADYPGDVRGKFSFSVAAEPMPKAEDFRVAGLSQADTEAITKDIDTRRGQAIEAAQNVAWERITDTVRKLQTKVAAFKPGDGKDEKAQGVFRDSLVDNLRELVTLIPSMNITGDKALEEISATVDTELCSYPAETLRKSEECRAEVQASAGEILARVQAIWATRGGASVEASHEATEAEQAA